MENNKEGVKSILPVFKFSAEQVELKDGTSIKGVQVSIDLGSVEQGEGAVKQYVQLADNLIKKAVAFWESYAHDEKDKRRYRYAMAKMGKAPEEQKDEEDFEPVE